MIVPRDSKSVVATLAILFSTVMGLGSADAVAAESQNGSDRWVPSLSVNFAYSFQDERGTVSSFRINPATGANVAVLRPSNDNQKLATSPHVGGTLEIMSPSFAIPSTPRIFFDGEILHISNQKRRVAREGDPSGLILPERALFSGTAVLGQGSTTLVDLKNVSYGAGVGIAFPFKIGDVRVLVKPSARYLRRTYRFAGIVTAAFRNGESPPTREVDLRANEELTVDALGPSIEFDVEAIRMKTVGVSVFVNGGAFKIMGNRSVAFSATAPDSIGQETFRGNFSAIIDPWIFRAGVGVRVKWLGLPSGWIGGGSSANSGARIN